MAETVSEISTKLPSLRWRTVSFELGDVGPYHLDVDGASVSGGAPRGPFKIQDVKPGHSATFPVLNGHDADRERTLEIAYDCEGVARVGKSAHPAESPLGGFPAQLFRHRIGMAELLDCDGIAAVAWLRYSATRMARTAAGAAGSLPRIVVSARTAASVSENRRPG